MSFPYTASTEALEQAARRLREPALQSKVAAYLGGVWPVGFEEISRPAAVYAPYLATGNGSEVDFLRKAAADGFEPVVATYRETRWSKGNLCLRDCYQPPLKLANGQEVREWAVPTKERAGPVGRAATKFAGLDIVEYWLGIRGAVLRANSLPSSAVVDFGDWYDVQARRFGWQSSESKSPFYYMASMGLYASGRAVLFDTPPTEYAGRVMQPAYEAAATQLGVAPLVTNVLKPTAPDWVDLSFLDEQASAQLMQTGRIGGVL